MTGPASPAWDEERRARLLFALAGVSAAARVQRLIVRFGSAAAALAAPPADWAADEDGNVAAAGRFARVCRGVTGAAVDAEIAGLERHAARFLIPSDAEYPEGLKTLPDAPVGLFVRGDFHPVDAFAVALVGTRTPTAYGRAAAERLAGDLARAGVTVVSGLARGIDTASHAAALRNRGRTLGILGSGFDRFYPPENRALADRMADQGAVVSEFPLATPPDRGNFPRRNRLISGLCLAVVVVEADEVSGALITARLAGEQGRDVFAVPGSVFSKFSRGPHRLLKQGAKLVEGVEDVLEEIAVFQNLIRATRPAAPGPAPEVSGPDGRLLGLLSLEPAGVDDLAGRSGLTAAALSSALLRLELKGLARALPGQLYVRAEGGLAAAGV